MVFHRRIPDKVRAYVHFLRQENNLSLTKISKRCNISISSVKRICGEKMFSCSQHRQNGRITYGRPRKISPQQGRYILRELNKLRRTEGSSSVPRLMAAAGISMADVSRRTVINFLHRHGYRYRQTRRKGLLSSDDLHKRKKFAMKMIKRPLKFWCDDVSFYIDAVSFVYKTNPLDQARTPKSRVLRKRNERLLPCCTTKGS